MEERMKIINLMENTKGSSGCQAEHGLSFYIETKKHKLLADTGASSVFLENASNLGIDLTAVDTVILSHGHYDHAGGILAFAQINQTAKIYMQKTAGKDYYHKSETTERYIGIDKKILSLPQVIFAEGNCKIDEELSLFTNVTERKLWPKGNLILKEKRKDEFIQDAFLHEQYLVLTQEGKKILISGCAHNGILNILDEYIRIYGTEPDIVISGFHTMKKNEYSLEDIRLIRETALELTRFQTIFYTGHCTGEVPYQIFKEIMGNQIHYVHSGNLITISYEK
jgi:7,8-dihydropterin-6-yl-methyl-4-(beta-D-ribofuranosyl)aminobenzene 5'-phosphate synthase